MRGILKSASAKARELAGRDRHLIKRYLRDHTFRRLQIGAGHNFREGWLNTDYPIHRFEAKSIALDASKTFPLPSDTFDYVFSEHVIEHIPYSAGVSMLHECFRVLKPGGKLRIATPDMDFLVGLLGRTRSPLQDSYIEWSAKCFLPPGQPATALAIVNNFVREWGHVFIYDRATLTQSLSNAGFVDIKPFGVGESDDPELAGIDNADRMPEGYLQLESMTFQAIKPNVLTTTSPASR